MPFPQSSRAMPAAMGLKVSGAVVLSLGLLAGDLAEAMEWGRARVLSGVGQPLSVEIPVRDLPAGLSAAQIRASVEAGHASDAGLADRQPLPLSVALLPRADGSDGAILVLASSQPVPRAVVDLALSLELPAGAERRRVVLLLSPAVAPNVTPIRLAARSGAATVRVAQGDTLGAVVTRLRRQAGPGSGNTEQWLVALFQANPHAFIQGNLNLVRAETVLDVPSADAVRAIDPAVARRLVAQHMRDFASLRGRSARQAAEVPATGSPSAQPGSTGQGQVMPAPAAAATPQNRDTLRLSSLLPGNGVAHAGTRDSQATIDQLRDERAATQRALDEARSRVGELESTVQEMEKLLTLQNDALARLQQAGAAGGTASASASAGATAGGTAGGAGRGPAVAGTASGSGVVAPATAAAASDAVPAGASAGDAATPAAASVAAGGTGQLADSAAPAAAQAAAQAAGTGAAPSSAAPSSSATPGASATTQTAQGATAAPGAPAASSAAGAQSPAAGVAATPASQPTGSSASAAPAIALPGSASPAGSTPAGGVAGNPAASAQSGAAPAANANVTPSVSGAGGALGTTNVPLPEASGSLPALASAPAARAQDGSAPAVAGSAASPAAGSQAPGSVTANGGAASASPAAAGTPPATTGQSAVGQGGTAVPPASRAAPAGNGAAVAEASSSNVTAWGLGALVLFALAVVFYLFRRRPEPAVVEDDEPLPAPPGAPPPLDLDFDLDLDSPPRDKPVRSSGSGPADKP